MRECLDPFGALGGNECCLGLCFVRFVVFVLAGFQDEAMRSSASGSTSSFESSLLAGSVEEFIFFAFFL